MGHNSHIAVTPRKILFLFCKLPASDLNTLSWHASVVNLRSAFLSATLTSQSNCTYFYIYISLGCIHIFTGSPLSTCHNAVFLTMNSSFLCVGGLSHLLLVDESLPPKLLMCFMELYFVKLTNTSWFLILKL